MTYDDLVRIIERYLIYEHTEDMSSYSAAVELADELKARGLFLESPNE